MSNKQAKKRKPSMFEPDQIKARIAAEEGHLREVREKLRALNEVDLGRLMADRCALTEDEALQLLASKISVTGLYNLRTALKHVPDNITRLVNRISLRLTLILKIFKSMASPGSECENMTIDDLSLYTEFAQRTYCSSFLQVKESDDHLWKLTESEEVVFNKFLTPPVSECLQCDKKLSVRGNPSKAILFTLDGPVPCAKVTLECRECSYVYGVCKYRSDESETRSYPKDLNIEFVEVSNVTYLHCKLYKWFPSLKNHCSVSFSGFAKAYNDVCESEIKQYGRSILEDDPIAGDEESTGRNEVNIGTLPGELSGKAIAKCFRHDHEAKDEQ